MPSNLYIDTVFAVDGDRTAVPDPTQGSGVVSYQQGYSIAYSTPVASGGYDFPRNQHNQILYDITAAIQNMQQNGAAYFITSAMNGGSAFSYILGAIVTYDAGSGMQVWISTAADNTTTPGGIGATWSPLTSPSSPLFIGGTSTGSANAQAIVTNQGNYANTAGNIVTFKAGISNTSSSTLTVDSVNNIPLKIAGAGGVSNTALGSLILGCEYICISDGTNLQVLNPTYFTNIKVTEFTTSGTWTPDTNNAFSIVRMTGAGGGSAGNAGNTGAPGAGAGGYLEAMLTKAQASTSQSVTIGAAGAAGASGTNNGGNGGTTSVGSLLSCTGGVGSAATTTGASSADFNLGGVGGAPTVTTGAPILLQNGGQGDSGGQSFYSVGGWAIGARGGSNPLGQGGSSVYTGSSNAASQHVAGNSGTGYGSGAGGPADQSATPIAGTAGQPGFVTILEFLT